MQNNIAPPTTTTAAVAASSMHQQQQQMMMMMPQRSRPCVRCGYPGCDVMITSCRCCLHARCAPVRFPFVCLFVCLFVISLIVCIASISPPVKEGGGVGRVFFIYLTRLVDLYIYIIIPLPLSIIHKNNSHNFLPFISSLLFALCNNSSNSIPPLLSSLKLNLTDSHTNMS